MKKLISIVALASALALVGCKKKEADQAAPKGTETATAPAAGTAPATAAPTGEGAATAAPTGEGAATAEGTQAAPGNTGSAECDEYLKTFDEVVAKCKDKLGPALQAMQQSRDAQAEAFKSWATLDEASRKQAIEAAATGCKSATDALKQSATSMGCTL